MNKDKTQARKEIEKLRKELNRLTKRAINRGMAPAEAAVAAMRSSIRIMIDTGMTDHDIGNQVIETGNQIRSGQGQW